MTLCTFYLVHAVLFVIRCSLCPAYGELLLQTSPWHPVHGYWFVVRCLCCLIHHILCIVPCLLLVIQGVRVYYVFFIVFCLMFVDDCALSLALTSMCRFYCSFSNGSCILHLVHVVEQIICCAWRVVLLFLFMLSSSLCVVHVAPYIDFFDDAVFFICSALYETNSTFHSGIMLQLHLIEHATKLS